MSEKAIVKTELPKAKYNGEVDLNGFKITCAVLENGQRVFSERSLATAFGIKGSGAYWKKKKGNSALLPEYLSAKYLKPFINKDLEEKFESALPYIAKSGEEARGIDVTVLPDICDVYVTAKNEGVRNEKFKEVADNAYKMIKAFAKVGIIALVDEATGYQYDREKQELQAILQLFISDEILDWQRTFQLSFYKEIFRLWGIPFTAENIRRKPSFIGHITNGYVYDNMPKGSFILENLKKRTPKTASGKNYKYRLFQSLTPLGKKSLEKVLYSVEALASISETKAQFIKFMNEKYGQKEIPFEDIEELNPAPKISKIENPTQFDKQLKGLLAVPPPKKSK
jgi:hypothetical protein